MKKIAPFLLTVSLLFACSSDNVRYRNPYLPDYSFSITVDQNLPLYSQLKNPISPVYINNGTTGVKGVIAMRVSDTDYRIWEASCPNHYPSACSTLQVVNVTNAKCPCEDNVYNLFDGDGPYEYRLKPYRYEVLGPAMIRIYN